MSKFAPANAEGQKPYVIVGWRWGREVTVIVYGETAASARYCSGFRGTAEYVISARRATPEDLATLDVR